MPDQTEPWTVRVIYILSADAEPWPEAKQRATECLEDLQWFFADQMKELHYEPKTFEIARDDDGSIVFYQIRSDLTSSEFRNTYWNNCKNAATNHRLRNLDYITIYFYEAYLITNGAVVDAGSSGKHKGKGGEAFLSSLHLKLARREWLGNSNGYGGEVFDWISSEAMRDDTLSWNDRGPTLGDVSGAGFGVIAHELAHCFDPPPQENGKRGPAGLLMGNGCRGMRGYFQPNLTNDRCKLRKEDAAVFDKSNFFAVRTLKPRSVSFP